MTDRDLADKYIEIQQRLDKTQPKAAIRENLEFYLSYLTNDIVERFLKKHASKERKEKQA